jgi:DNA-binding NtrC family response regulator
MMRDADKDPGNDPRRDRSRDGLSARNGQPRDRALALPDAPPAVRSTRRETVTRALVVEDDAAVRHVIDRILTRNGFHVVMAPTADLATAMMVDYSWAPEIAIIDLVLPGIDGLTFGLSLEREFPGIRLVFMTGYFDPSRISDAEARGRVLLKPFTGDALLRYVLSASPDQD